MKIVIGIILRNGEGRNMTINREILQALIHYGALPIGLYPSNMDDLINICDGFILQGGDEFTSFDLELVKKIYKLNKPLLGICLGMQTMGCAFSGNLVPCKNHRDNKLYVHKINIARGTLLHQILNKDYIFVNSRHNECIKFTNLTVSATSDDGIIEAIEDYHHKFFLGVQWHPETLMDENSELIFKKFIDTCRG